MINKLKCLKGGIYLFIYVYQTREYIYYIYNFSESTLLQHFHTQQSELFSVTVAFKIKRKTLTKKPGYKCIKAVSRHLMLFFIILACQ